MAAERGRVGEGFFTPPHMCWDFVLGTLQIDIKPPTRFKDTTQSFSESPLVRMVYLSEPPPSFSSFLAKKTKRVKGQRHRGWYKQPLPLLFTPGQEDKKMTISPLHPRVIQPNLIMFFSIPIYFSSSWPGRQRGRPLQPILTFTTVAPKGPSTDPPRPIGSANIQGHVQIRTLNHISRL